MKLSSENKIKRLQFVYKYKKKINWKRRTISSDEVKIKKIEYYSEKT